VGKQDKSGKKSCFVIAPLGEDGSAVRERSDKVFRHVIQPVVEECGYSPLRSDIEPTPGMIGQQIINHLLNDDLVIADLTGQNANVFYELAIRHMANKPIVQIIEKGEGLPFDITQSRTIFLDHTDLDSVDACRQEINRQIREMERDPDLIANPMTQAVRIEMLRESPDPQDQRDAEILLRLDRLSAQVEMLLMDRQTHRPPIDPFPVSESGVSPVSGAVLVNGNAYRNNLQPASPVDQIIGTSATLEAAVQRFQVVRGAGQPGEIQNHAGETAPSQEK
jgi:hypothetical protein